MMKALLIKMKQFLKTKTESMRPKSVSAQSVDSTKTAFTHSVDWETDVYAQTVLSRHRYQAAFIAAGSLCGLLVVALIMLLPLKTLQPLIIHHYPDGEVSVNATDLAPKKVSQKQSQADIIRFITAFDSYFFETIKHDSHIVAAMASNDVYSQYEATIKPRGKASLVKRLGKDKVRQVRIESVFIEDSEEKSTAHRQHVNTATVDYVVLESHRGQQHQTRTPKRAVIQWKYRGIPDDNRIAMLNWDGFLVTHFRVSDRYLTK